MIDLEEKYISQINEKLTNISYDPYYKFILSDLGRAEEYKKPPIQDNCHIDLVSLDKNKDILGYIYLYRNYITKTLCVTNMAAFSKEPMKNSFFIKDMKEVLKKYFVKDNRFEVLHWAGCEDNPATMIYINLCKYFKKNYLYKYNITKTINDCITFDNKFHNTIHFQVFKYPANLEDEDFNPAMDDIINKIKEINKGK